MFYVYITHLKGLPDSSVVECTCNAGDTGNERDTGLIPGSGRSLEGGNDNHSSILAWKIPWTKEPGRPQSMGSQRARHD